MATNTIPTVTEWGLIAMVAMFLSTWTVALKRRWGEWEVRLLSPTSGEMVHPLLQVLTRYSWMVAACLAAKRFPIRM